MSNVFVDLNMLSSLEQQAPLLKKLIIKPQFTSSSAAKF